MKGLGTDKLMPEGKKREGATLDVTQEAAGSPSTKKENKSGSGPLPPGHFDSPVISEAGDSDGLKISEHADKEREKKEEAKKTLSKEKMEEHAENDANLKRKVMEEVTNMARKLSREEIEDEKKAENKKKDDKKKTDKAFSPILKPAAKSPENHKSRSDSRKKKKSKIRDEINGGRKPEYIKQDDDERSGDKRPRGGGRARTPGLENKDEHRRGRVGDESDEIILAMLRENREKEREANRSNRERHVRAPAFDELEHPRCRGGSKQHELVRGGGRDYGDQRISPVKSARSLSAPKNKAVSEPRHIKSAPNGSHPVSAPQQTSSEGKSYFSSRRRTQLTIIILCVCLLASLTVVVIQAAFISSKCGLK